MRNVQKWTRDLDDRTVRVFQFRGSPKTTLRFFEGNEHLGLVKRHSGAVVHNKQKGTQTFISSGDFLCLRDDGELAIVKNEHELFSMMHLLSYAYRGNERVRNTQLTEDQDYQFIMRWAEWTRTLPDDTPSKVYHQRDVVEDEPVPVAPVRTDAPEPYQWKSEEISTSEPPLVKFDSSLPVPESKKPVQRKSFAQRLLGFLRIFR